MDLDRLKTIAARVEEIEGEDERKLGGKWKCSELRVLVDTRLEIEDVTIWRMWFAIFALVALRDLSVAECRK